MNYAILLAAGRGSRMQSEIPKCAMEVLGKPMISYLVDNIKKTSIQEVLCVVGYQKEYIMNLLKDEVKYVIQEEPLGSGHAVGCCKGIVEDGYTIILNGDTPLIDYQMISRIIQEHIENDNDLTIATFLKDSPTGYGRIIRNDQNEILGIVEEVELRDDQKEIKEVNSGVYCVRTNLLFDAISKIKVSNVKKEYYLTEIVQILQGHKISSVCFEDGYRLMGANTLMELSQLEENLRVEILHHHIAQGVRIIGIQDTWIGPDVMIEKNSVISHSKIMGKSIIHSNAQIYQSEICNSIILNDCNIRHSVVYNSIVGKACNVGPFSHIRDNAMLHGENRIGNFVEIKNSTVGIKTKLSHLAYMGDTMCGENVNFGCGSITVNYDGKRKNKTMIGDNAFIGCNSNLIAPIHIEANSFIAAGSTITQSLEEGDFAIARSMQVTKKGYATKYEKE